MHFQSWSLLATTLASLVTSAHAKAELQFNAANYSSSQILLWDYDWQLTSDGGITTKDGWFIIRGNVKEFFLTWLAPNADTQYGFLLDGKGINPFADGLDARDTVQLDGTTWEKTQTGIRVPQGDHQLLIWTANPGGVIYSAYNMSSDADTVFPSTFGREATSIPSSALVIDNNQLSYSPEGWQHMTRTPFFDGYTLSNSSVVGSWVEFKIYGLDSPSFWIYGAMASKYSQASVEVIGYKSEAVVYNETEIVRVGGSDDGQDLYSPVYQTPLFSRRDVHGADYYRVRMTLLKGALMIDFLRSTAGLIPAEVTFGSVNSRRGTILRILLPTLLVCGAAISLAIGWLLWRRRRLSAAAKKKTAVDNETIVQVGAFRRTSTASSSSSLDEKVPLPL